MKKRILGVVLTMSMLFGMTVTASADPKASWNAAKGTAVVDGQKDDIYAGAQKMKLAAVSDGTSDGTTANAWAVWDDKAFYVFVEVKDSKLDDKSANWYEKDQVEFRLDNKDQLLSCYAVSEKLDGKVAESGKVLKTADGYNVELKVPYDTSKGKCKFVLQVDAAADGKRNCTLHTNEDLANAYQSDAVFETLVFSNEIAKVTEDDTATVAPTAAPTVAPTKAPAKKAPAKKVTKKKATKKVTKKATKKAKKKTTKKK